MDQNVDFEFEPESSVPSRIPIELSVQDTISRPRPIDLNGLKGISQNEIEETRNNLGRGYVVPDAGSVEFSITEGNIIQLTQRERLRDKGFAEFV